MSNNYEFVKEDSPDNMKAFAEEHGFSFPYLVDEDQSVAKAYGAVCTPDIFGFNGEGKMQYRGNSEGLLAAMEQIAENGTGPAKQSASQGCSIKWK
ncbi:MAG: redoxin domain-containing protein [Phycisphaerales bacterium]|nr:redoxin domain-containing protein [Phycisphaerales bacterium]